MVFIYFYSIKSHFEYLELFYSGESIPYRTIVSLTCPYCSVSGLTSPTLLTHCLENHSDNQTSQVRCIEKILRNKC